MEKSTLHIVIAGHIDHGKSTLIGRLFYDTGSLPPEKLIEIKSASEAQGRETEFAYVMDHLKEERQRGITIDIAHTFFETEKRKYVIIDAPGHKEFLKNMISGSSQAEAALLLVDISEGIREQTRRHCYILNLLGIKQVAVLVNKMDLKDYSREAYEDFRNEILKLVEQFDIQPTNILPISASRGDNIAKHSEKLSWFQGPTVLEALDELETAHLEEKDLRFPVQDIYEIDGQSIAVGRVEAGILRKGEELSILPDGKKCVVSSIVKFQEEDLTEAPLGDCVGVSVEGPALKRGHVLENRSTSSITDTIHANIFWMVDVEYKLGMSVTWKCVTQEVKGKIEKIYKRFDPASVEVVETEAKEIKPAEIAEVQIKLERPVAVDKFTDYAEMGRFVLENGGHPVAGGIII